MYIRNPSLKGFVTRNFLYLVAPTDTSQTPKSANDGKNHARDVVLRGSIIFVELMIWTASSGTRRNVGWRRRLYNLPYQTFYQSKASKKA